MIKMFIGDPQNWQKRFTSTEIQAELNFFARIQKFYVIECKKHKYGFYKNKLSSNGLPVWLS